MTPFENELDQLLTEAEALLQDQKPVEALDLLARAQTLEPHYAWTMLFRGVALGQLGKTEEAVPQLIGAADDHREDIDIQVDAARHLSVLEYHQDALICANRAIEIDTNDAGAHAVRAEVLERLGRIEEALPARETAIALDPEDTDSRYYLAVDYCDLGRYQEAFKPRCRCSSSIPTIRIFCACMALACPISIITRKRWANGRSWSGWKGSTPTCCTIAPARWMRWDAGRRRWRPLTEAIAEEPENVMNYYTRGMIHEHAGEDDRRAGRLPAHAQNGSRPYRRGDQSGGTGVVHQHLLPHTGTPAGVQQHAPTSAKLLYVQGRLAMDEGDLRLARRALEAAIQAGTGVGHRLVYPDHALQHLRGPRSRAGGRGARLTRIPG